MPTSALLTAGRCAVAATGLALAASLPAAAHPPLDETMTALSRTIERAPSVFLLCRRAELELLAGDPERAQADVEQAAALDPERPEPWLIRAKLALERGDPAGALDAARAARRRCGDCVAALLSEAHARDESGDARAALVAFDAALAKLRLPRPEDWLERAEMAERGVGADEALRGLGVAIERAGDLLPLHFAALDLECRLHRTGDALRRLDRLEAIADPIDVVARRADVLDGAGRSLEAQAEYTRALEEIESLAPQRRTRPGIVALEARVRARLRRAP